jgi:carboxymethylenebutenolidase
MDQKIIDLYDAFTHGALERRDFLDRLGQVAGGAAAAAALLGVLQNDYAQAAVIAEDDPRLLAGMADYDAGGTRVSGYLARLKGGARRPAVVVVHENRGLNPHIRDVARRLGVEGFLALAPDALAPLGGTPADEDKARELIGTLDRDQTVARLAAAVPYLASHPESTGKVGAVGFCWGGGMVNRLAAAGTSLAAAVAYYGQTLPAEEVPKVSAALLLHYAGKDERIDAGIPAYEAALKEHRKPYQLFVYEGAQHAFNNDTNAARYDRAAAELAWGRTLEFLRQQLGAGSSGGR